MQTKDEIRMKIWRLMEERNLARFPRPVFHRIPNFVGAEKAARRLRELLEYKAAKIIFCSPDSPQRPVRRMALEDEKIVIMATPKLKRGFIMLNPKEIPRSSLSKASTISGAFSYGKFINPSHVSVDLFVVGSVAVSLDGGRLGKGGGYSDREYDILMKSGSLKPQTPVATTVHDVQVLESIPQDFWDIPVDIIATPTRIIRVSKIATLK